MVGRGLWRAAAAACLVAGMAAPAAAQQPAPPAITVTPLLGPEGEPMISADHINDAGLITGRARPRSDGPVLGDRAVVRHGDTAWYFGQIGVTVTDVSERGQVVGQQFYGLGGGAFSWADGVFTLLVDPPPGDDPNEYRPFFVTAAAVNERGQVVGVRGHPQADPLVIEAAVWEDGRVVAATGGASAYDEAAVPADLNDRGQVLLNVPGDADDARVAAAWRIGGRQVTELGTLGGARSLGLAIDERGRVAGVSETASGDEHAFLWQRGRMVDLGTLGGATSAIGPASPSAPLLGDRNEAVNDRGEVAGTSETASGDEHAFLWRGGRMVDLGTLGGATSHATALNDRGQVVGYSETADGETHAFLWQDGEMTDLGALAGEGASEALDVNDRGQIVGRVGDQAVLWTVTA
jgi:probable HAF family extracellular repeat protein